MNYYERIQKAVDYIEDNLDSELDIEAVAREAFMSLANLYRLFFALTGHTVKEYIRSRRLSLAAQELLEGSTRILETALKYGFDSHEAFARAFKRVVGVSPSVYKKQRLSYKFERVNILDKYFDVQDPELLEKYPEIKVLKKLEPFRVAYCCYYGREPENGAWQQMSQWLRSSGLNIERDGLRFFGFNNPNPAPGQEEYGYEIWTTIGEAAVVNSENIRTKTLEGGLYAVTSVTGGGEALPPAWKRLMSWLSDSRYSYGGHQWLEEHLGFDDEFNHTGHIDIYMPIEPRDDVDSTKTFEDVAPMWTACYRATGRNAIEDGRKYFFEWAEGKGLFEEPGKHRFFAYYNHEREGQEDFFYEICVSVDRGFEAGDSNITMKEFRGGHYAVMHTVYKRNGWSWGEFMQWIAESSEYCFGNGQFFEEYLLDGPKVEMDTEMVLYMPVVKKKG